MTPPVQFTLAATCGAARAGVLRTPHGEVPTPAFMPVATQATVKTLTPQEVRRAGAAILLGNTYHLYLRPGVEVVQRLGGLHHFMGWDGPILTDSGGFQVFSLGNLREMSDEGVRFRSHLDGSEHLFTPEAAVAYQEALGADIAMCLDHCLVATQDREAARRAMERTHRWAQRCRDARARPDQALFGIVQGGVFPDLREESAAAITSIGFDGYAIGGLAVGETKETMVELTRHTAALLPAGQPRYLMGVGAPEDLVEGVAAGVDMFDCALPTRVARNGALFTPAGRVDITAARWRLEPGPVDPHCDCEACTGYSAAYLHHLFRARELLGLRLASLHNLRFVLRLMERLRAAVLDGTFQELRASFLAAYRPTDEARRMQQKQAWLEQRGIRGDA